MAGRRLDLVLIALATVLAIRFRVSLSIFDTAGDVLENTALASVFFVGTWLVMLAFFGTYERHVFGAGTEEFKLVVNASFFTGALVATMAFLMQYPLSRGFFVLLFPIGVTLLVLGRLLSRRVIQRLRVAGHFNEKVLLVGTPGYIGEIHTVLARESWLGYQVMGCLVPRDYAGLEQTSSGIPVLGLIDEVRAVVDEHAPDIVFFTAGAVSSSTQLRRLAWDLEDHAARADHRRPQRHRRLQRAGPDPSGRRAAAHAPGPLALPARDQRRQARLRRRRCAGDPGPGLAAAASG